MVSGFKGEEDCAAACLHGRKVNAKKKSAKEMTKGKKDFFTGSLCNGMTTSPQARTKEFTPGGELSGFSLETSRPTVLIDRYTAAVCTLHVLAGGYNSTVDSRLHKETAGRRRRHAVYATETSGLLLIAFLLLLLILIRYWHSIYWSWR